MKIIYLLLFISSVSNAQSNCSCNDLKEGVFESYDGSKKTGIIYRKGGYQLEKGVNDSIYNIVKIKSRKCLFFYNSYNVRKKIDTITWSIDYKKLKKGKYIFTMKPTYLISEYFMTGRIIKRSNYFNNKEVLNIFRKINIKSQQNTIKLNGILD